MKKTLLFERIIADFRHRPTDRGTRRQVKRFAKSGKVDAIVGMRRTGKTTYCVQEIASLHERGISADAILYMNFEDDRLQPLQLHDLDDLLETFFRLNPESRTVTSHLFFDEIQIVDGWEQFIRRIIDTETVQVVVTGSSARMLSRDIATSLRGRALTTEIFPFSFSEFLSHRSCDSSQPSRAPAQRRSLLANECRCYLERGGFPEAQDDDAIYRTRLLQGYVDSVILRDIIERYGISKPVPVRCLTRKLLHEPARSFSVNKFYNDLRSQGVSCSKDSLYEYLAHLVDSYLIYTVPIHSRSQRVRQVNPQKIYAVDTGLLNAFAFRERGDVGPLLENAVFLHLRRAGGPIEYVRTKMGYEVDFWHRAIDGSRQLVQVCADLGDGGVRERELRALSAAMQELRVTRGTIVTLDEEDELLVESKTIQVVPLWKWLLS